MFRILFLLFTIALSNLYSQNVLFKSDKFSISENSIIEGKFKATVDSNGQMKSNYLEAFEEGFNRNVRFKFCINGEDNENLPGLDHSFFINPVGGKQISPLFIFGFANPIEQNISEDEITEINFGQKFQLTFRVDMTDVLNSFDKKGFYETRTGAKILKEQFEFVSIAGGTPPLDWSFGKNNVKEEFILSDDDNDRIFEVTINYEKKASRNFENGFFVWNLSKDISALPQYKSDFPIINSLYNLSLEEMLLDIREDGAFMAGAKWTGIWTRDISYSIILSLAAINPEASKKSLLAKVKNGIIIQDTGTGGSWPVSTDRMVWAIAAWEIFNVNGDKLWLKQAYDIIYKTAESDLYNIFDESTGLVNGESSFLDWREQTYPTWMDPKDIYVSKTLGTNAVHYKVYSILFEMSEILGEPKNNFHEISEKIKNGINKYLWIDDAKIYSQFLYGRNAITTSNRAEALGSALAVLFDIAPTEKRSEILEHFPVTEYGVPSIYPHIPKIPNYHNNGIWPFVTAFYAWAGSKSNNEKAVEHGLASIYRAAGLFLTNKENFVSTTGSSLGTEINSDRQLWSVAGNIATVFRIFFGMNFEIDGIYLNPFIPYNFEGNHSLSNFTYRNSILDITIEGFGNLIDEVYLDNKKISKAFIPANLVGEHTLFIKMGNNKLGGKIQLVENQYSPETPKVLLYNNKLIWNDIKGAVNYNIYQNGKKLISIDENEFKISVQNKKYQEFQISAISDEGFESFLSEPITSQTSENQPKFIYPNNENKLVMTTTKENTKIIFPINIEREGIYYIDVLYANGSGPLNTDNKCAVRSLFIDGEKISTIVLPQRGTGLWENWGFSNSIKNKFAKGNYSIEIVYENLSQNMNEEINDALIKSLRLTPAN